MNTSTKAAGMRAADNAHLHAAHDPIYEKMYAAIFERRLPPGTKLGEDKLAGIFGVSRARIRQTLARLAFDQIIELIPQRGAFVASPTPQQARDVFEARRLIEPALVARLIGDVQPTHLAQLKAHVKREMAARASGDQHAVVRLSGEFHTLLGDLAGNSALAASLRQMCAQTVLIIALYDSPTRQACRADEHEQLVAAIEAKDTGHACALMLEHLRHIEAGLVLHKDAVEVDLQAVFSDALE
ncbi:GntR family transcriptional regulator [Lampropedia puyangensis]|uniref:GntR family transcriptional regulator n=1 Tax=Lampropedia puyangensis TaxID=1330072 RepID=A0A4S8FB90_9BURK|nr:GntR family transcriptional regulator [Lampropedia puyangensis]THU04489.1 GntR family transcriptional regulator [Lampropedia puyangensis]